MLALGIALIFFCSALGPELYEALLLTVGTFLQNDLFRTLPLQSANIIFPILSNDGLIAILNRHVIARRVVIIGFRAQLLRRCLLLDGFLQFLRLQDKIVMVQDRVDVDIWVVKGHSHIAPITRHLPPHPLQPPLNPQHFLLLAP